jgi:hypothetical protein
MYHDTQFDPEPGNFRVRSSERLATAFAATVVRDGLPDLPVRIRNFSRAGFLATSEETVPRGTFLWLRLPHVGEIGGEVKWCRRGLMGCEFDRGLTSRQYLEVMREPEFKTVAKTKGIMAGLARLVSR